MREKVILKSVHPEMYPDLVIECRIIENDKIGEYLDSVPEEKKFVAYKTGEVTARRGIPGETVRSILKTMVDRKEYILSEEENVVKNRTYMRETKLGGGCIMEQQVTEPDVVVTNISSTSNEKYIVKHQKFEETYELVGDSIFKNDGMSPRWVAKYDPRVLTQIDENVIIMTAWGTPAVCLAGNYIVTYNASQNDYNTLEKGAFDSTYTKEDKQVKKMEKK